jgi:hypothetical protein
MGSPLLAARRAVDGLLCGKSRRRGPEGGVLVRRQGADGGLRTVKAWRDEPWGVIVDWAVGA